jgi:Domain of unknown function (DUF4249)
MTNYLKVAAGIILLFAGCKQIYDPKVEAKNIRLLVVEGFLNSGQGPTSIRLSRTADLKDTTANPELSARVNVEGENGSNFILTANSNGEYSIPQLTLDNNVRYRLRIKTIDGREYASGYVSVKYTPPIDSITWQRDNGGLRLYTNAHNLQNDTKYYEWKYEETWEFHSAFYSSKLYIWDTARIRILSLADRKPDGSDDTTIYRCWKTLNSTSIILGSTEKLTADIVYLPVQYIEPRSEKLSVLYSLNLRQYAISHEEYLFLQRMKKNTEQLGSIFDAQPSELAGNIHCLTDPNETVLGYVEITQEQIKRIFIYNSQIADWNYNPGCVLVQIDKNPDSIAKYGYDLIPTHEGGNIFYASTPQCVDCTIGRTNKKPFFWP